MRAWCLDANDPICHFRASEDGNPGPHLRAMAGPLPAVKLGG
jgi:hypothetical protein